MRLIIYNICYAQGFTGALKEYITFWKAFTQNKINIAQISSFLSAYNPDIIGLVEIDTGSIRSKLDQATLIKNNTGNSHCVTQNKYTLFKHLPIFRKQANAFFSNTKIQHSQVHYTSKGVKRAIIETTMETPFSITYFLVHLSLRKKTRSINLKN